MHSESFAYDESVFCTELHHSFADIIEAERNAALCLAIVAARQMEKNRTTLSRHDGRIVEADHYDDIVEPVLAPQPLVQARIRQADQAVVMGIVRHVAPGLVRLDWRSGEDAPRPPHPVGAVKHASHG